MEKALRLGVDATLLLPASHASRMQEWTLEDANRRLAEEGYPPIRRLPADAAALASWRRIVDAKRQLDETGKVEPDTLLAISAFCHCLKCPTYPRGEKPAVYCLHGKTAYEVKATHCKCPTCAVYEVGAMEPERYFCMRGAASRGVVAEGGVAEAARRFLAHEVEEGNPGKRLPERLMAPPQFLGLTQHEVDVPEKVPGWE